MTEVDAPSSSIARSCIWRARRRNAPMARAGRLREAVRRMIDRPERVAVEPTALQRIVGAAGSAAAAFLIRAALERLAESARPTAPGRLGGVEPGRSQRDVHAPGATRG